MNRLKVTIRNLRLLLSSELAAVFETQEQKLDQRIDAFEARAAERADAFEAHTAERADNYERALDTRLEERFGALEQRSEERHAAQEQRADTRADNYEAAFDARFEERFGSLEQHNDERFSALEQRNDERFSALERRNDERQSELNQRFAERQAELDQRFAERQAELDQRFDQAQTELDQRSDQQRAELDQRFDDRARAVDNRLDDRFARIERQLDERFEMLEKRTDARMESHEKRTDYNLKLNRADILDRTDVMLQIFEQRLDQQRREIKALREQLANAQTPAAHPHTGNGSHNAPQAVEPPQILADKEPAQQVQSFRKLAQSSGLIGKTKLPVTDSTLYQKILDWKKVAAEKVNEFTPDEQEVVDYILSFIHDAAERHYTTQHLRRFVATLQRIPPPQRSTDRLLELGSLLHLAPAIKKFCGYQEIYGADFWESEKKVVQETLKQVNGSENHTFELRNFNVEAEPFPYPDGHFRVVLCCELLEHLQHDPLHMLWECNRVLMDDGFLLLTTPNITSARSLEGVLIGCAPYLLSQYNRTTPVDQHHREYAPYEVGLALAAAGFTVIELETEDVWLRSNPAILKLLEEVNLPTHLRGDNIFALARKTSAPLERYPKEFYIE